MFGGIGVTELLILLAIVLLIFGAGKLPEIGSGLGKAITNFKKATKDSPENSKKIKNNDDNEKNEKQDEED